MTENVCCLKLLKKLNNCTAQTMQKKWNSFIFIHKIPSLASNLRVLFNDAAGALMAVSWNFIPIIYPETCQSQLQRGSVIAPLRWRAAPKLRRSFAAQSAHRIDADESAWICGSFFLDNQRACPQVHNSARANADRLPAGSRGGLSLSIIACTTRLGGSNPFIPHRSAGTCSL